MRIMSIKLLDLLRNRFHLAAKLIDDPPEEVGCFVLSVTKVAVIISPASISQCGILIEGSDVFGDKRS